MQNQIFQSSAKFKNKSDTFTYNLIEIIALIFNSKVVFKKLFWLKLFILKNTLNEPNPLTPRGNKRSHILK